MPHEAGLREVREETGLAPTLVDDTTGVEAPNGETLPTPRHTMLYDVNVHGGTVGHQHVDHVFFARADSRTIDPADGEEPPAAWSWYTAPELRASDLESDTVEIGLEAIRAVEAD